MYEGCVACSRSGNTKKYLKITSKGTWSKVSRIFKSLGIYEMHDNSKLKSTYKEYMAVFTLEGRFLLYILLIRD